MLKLKLDDNGNVVLQDGKPVWVDDKGKEFAYDANQTNETLAALRRENQGLRTDKEKAEAALKPFEGIDPEKAKSAIDTVAHLDDKKLVDAGEVQKVKDEAVKAVHEQYKPVIEERDTLKVELKNERLGNRFNGSEFIKDKCVVPPDMVQSRFGTQFKDEDGKLVGYDAAGNKIYSRTPGKEGQVAEFDEALEIMIEGYAHKASILKGTGHSGTGGGPGAEGAGGKNPWKAGATFNLSEQDRIEAKDPAMASRLKAEAGVAA